VAMRVDGGFRLGPNSGRTSRRQKERQRSEVDVQVSSLLKGCPSIYGMGCTRTRKRAGDSKGYVVTMREHFHAVGGNFLKKPKGKKTTTA